MHCSLRVGNIPLFLATVPPSMDTPSYYDGNGEPIAVEIRTRCADRRDYIGKVQLMAEGGGE